jgi:flagellin-like protein
MKFRNIRKNVKAISPVISVLLMIAVAVVASLVAYAWVMGYMGFQTAKTGQAIQIQSVDPVNKVVYVQNVGDGMVSFSDPCVFVDGTGYVSNATSTKYDKGETVGLYISGATFTAGNTYTVKVTTTDGTFSQVTKIIPAAP